MLGMYFKCKPFLLSFLLCLANCMPCESVKSTNNVISPLGILCTNFINSGVPDIIPNTIMDQSVEDQRFSRGHLARARPLVEFFRGRG